MVDGLGAKIRHVKIIFQEVPFFTIMNIMYFVLIIFLGLKEHPPQLPQVRINYKEKRNIKDA